MRNAKQKRDALDEHINMIASAVNAAKRKAIRRIVKQLERMSPNDVRNLERLLGKR